MTSSLALAIGILASSFFGSWHCAGMCGPVASLMGQRGKLPYYHLGRLISYVLLGALAGGLGKFFLSSEFVELRWLSSSLLAIILVVSGSSLIWPKFFAENRISHQILSSFKSIRNFHLGHSSFVVGLLTALLPCGWLYTYVTAAVAAKSAWGGALILFLFWLGGLPALSALPLMVRKTISTAGLRNQKIAGFILIFAGLYSIASFLFLH